MPRLTLPGTYVVRFAGFDRADTHARHLTGLGKLVLEEVDGRGTIRGGHRSTNSPMFGRLKDLTHSEYTLSGAYAVIDAGPPVMAEATVTFTRTDGYKMSDRFAIVQSGPDRLWLMSTDPQDGDYEAGAAADRKLQELVLGEIIKVDMGTW